MKFLVCSFLLCNLVDSVSYDEHLLDPNTHHQKWNRAVERRNLVPAKEEQAKARSEGTND